jgi:hypothetical protein
MMTRRTLFVLNTVLFITGFTIGCGGDEPTDPSPLPCSYTLSPSSHAIGSDGGPGTVTVTTRSDCQWTAAASASWIAIVAGASGTGNGSIGYSVAANQTQAARTGTIAIAGSTFTITQDGRAACTFDVSPQQQNFAAAGGNGTIHVAAPSACSWTATTTAPWLTISSGASGQGTGDVSYTVAENKATESRGGTVDVAGAQVAVAQAAAEVQPPPIPTDCQYSVAPVELRMHWHQEGGDVSLTTAAGCRWTVDSDTPWLTLASDPQGTGSGTIRFSMSTYTEENSRAAALRVRWPTPTAGQNVWVTQEGCTYDQLHDRMSLDGHVPGVMDSYRERVTGRRRRPVHVSGGSESRQPGARGSNPGPAPDRHDQTGGEIAYASASAFFSPNFSIR